MKRKKLLSFLAVLMVWLLVVSSALAITVDDTAREVYGDGDSITVTGDGNGHNTVSSNTSDESHDFNGDYAIYGGSKDADVDGDTSVIIGDGAVVGDVYGGGHNGDVDGNTNVVIQNGATTGDVYGGGHAEGGDVNSNGSVGNGAKANVNGDTNVAVEGGDTGDVYGGGHAEGGDANKAWSIGGPAEANVEGQANVTISGGSTGDVHGGGKSDNGERRHKYAILGGPAVANVEDTNVEVKGGTVEGDVYGGGSSGNLGLAKVGNDTQVTISGAGVVEGAVYGSGDTALLTHVEGESRIIIEGGDIQSGQVYANQTNTRIDLNDTSAFYYTYHVLPGCKDFQLNDPIVAEYGEPQYVRCEGIYWIYQFQGVSAPRDVKVIFQYTYNGNIIDAVTKTVKVEFFQTGDRGVTVSSTYAGSDLYKPASGEATVYFDSQGPVIVPIGLERYPRDNDDDDDDVPLNPGAVPGAEDVPLGVPSTGGLTDWSILVAALGFAGLMVVRETRRKKS